MKLFIKYLIIAISAVLFLPDVDAQETYSKDQVLEVVNNLRAKGCKCGRKKMKPVGPLTWNDLLAESASNHAKDMHQKRYFSHFSKKGEDVGQRVEQVGYTWIFVGENIAEGQKTLKDVMEDWIKSKSHCEMLMNADMREFGMAKYKDKWVQHFGTQLPKGARLRR